MAQYQLLPALATDEYDALKADIEMRGVLVPVEYDELGNILDGHHRVTICAELGITNWPRLVRVGMSEEEKRNHVRALNLLRRHLSKEQMTDERRKMRADGAKYQDIADATGASIGTVHKETRDVELFRNEKLMGADGKARPGSYTKKPVTLFNPTASMTTRAREVCDSGNEDLISEVGETGKVDRAYQTLMRSRQEPAPPLPEGKYQVLYADPPWNYGDKLIDGYGAAEHHYPSMTIQELCDLPISDLVADNAVLFLWVTSPLLEECFAVIKAWGMKYKASFVWDKVRHNYGHYNSVRHELLLVCTRGSYLPEVKELFDSVMSIERGNHSVKPVEFRELIEKLYPTSRKIELFAREQNEGWLAWGNEV